MALPPLNIQVSATTSDAETGLKRTEAQLKATGRAAQVTGMQMRSAGGHTANLAAQFNDIGVMLAAGQSPLMLALQQGTQINQVFAQMGGGATALRGLGAAFTSLINPMSLATIGIIAGGAALIQWGMSALGAGDEAKKLSSRLDEIAASAANARQELQQGVLGVTADELVLIGQINEKMGELNGLREKLADADNRQARSLRGAISAREQELSVLQGQLSEIRNIADQKQRLLNDTRETSDAERMLGEQITVAAQKAAVLAYELGQAKQQAVEAAQEWLTLQGLRSRFAGEEMVMGQDVLQVGRGDTLPRSSGSTGGGRSGGVDPRAGQLASLVDSLQTEREIIAEWYEESLNLLNSATDAELAEIGGKHAAMQRLEQEHQDRMNGITQGGMSGALGVYQQYGAQILGAMGATGKQMALINAAIGASQALADPTIPFWGKFAAVAQVLAAGRSLSDQAGGSSGAGASVAAVETQSITRTVDVNLTGGTPAAQTSIRDLIADINDAIGDGATLNVTGMA